MLLSSSSSKIKKIKRIQIIDPTAPLNIEFMKSHKWNDCSKCQRVEEGNSLEIILCRKHRVKVEFIQAHHSKRNKLSWLVKIVKKVLRKVVARRENNNNSLLN